MAPISCKWTGYRQAVIHLAWFRNDKVRHLLFGMVELRPSEFPETASSEEQHFRAKNRGRLYLHYRRFALTVTDAIDWYKRAIRGDLSLPADPYTPTPGDGAKLLGGPFVDEPAWPHLVTSNKLDFAPEWVQGSRAHFLYAKKELPRKIKDLIQEDKNRIKLKEWLLFDLVDAYYEYQGAMCLIAPNPLFRSIQKTHLEKPNTGSAETVAYKLVARQGQCLSGLRMEIVNECLRGRMTPVIHKFDNDAIAVLEFPEKINREGRAITHPDYGLLYWLEPTPIVRRVRIEAALQRRRKRVHVPASGQRPAYSYDVSEKEKERDMVVGKDRQNVDVGSRLVQAEYRRSRRQAAAEQHWFHDSPTDAAQYIRDKIGAACGSVLIADPYFAGRELLAFGHAIQWQGVQLRILTSTECLKGKGRVDENISAGKELQRVLKKTFKSYSTKPEIRVLGGKVSDLHDRFLVVDEKVWLSGNSLHTIGERAGMIVGLPDPEPVIGHLEDLWDSAKPLARWLAKPMTTRPK